MYTYIETPEALEKLVRELADADCIAIDTEFISERSYTPRLALIQLAAKHRVFLVDPVALPDLHALGPVLSSPDRVVVVHNGEVDCRLLYQSAGATLPRLFDTQLAAAFVGLPEGTGLAVLVRHFANARVAKGQQVTDWLRRPLTEAQLGYAANDVRHLERIYQRLHARLVRSRRVGIYEEELAARRQKWEQIGEPNARFKKILASSHMTERRKRALLDLWAWRDGVAEARDLPRQQIMGDDVLTALAEALPKNISDLMGLRLVPEKIKNRHGEAIVSACASALELPDTPLPKEEAPPLDDPKSSARAKLVKLALEVLAVEVGIAPGLIARAEEAETLSRAAGQGETLPELPCLEGWRGRLVGKKLWDFARGRKSLRLNPERKGPTVLLEDVPEYPEITKEKRIQKRAASK